MKNTTRALACIACAAASMPAAAQASPLSPAFGSAPSASLERLASSRGGSDTTSSTEQNGRVTGNQANQVQAAPNVIRDGSFSASSGLVTVIQNSGSNVLIQNSMTVIVKLP